MKQNSLFLSSEFRRVLKRGRSLAAPALLLCLLGALAGQAGAQQSGARTLSGTVALEGPVYDAPVTFDFCAVDRAFFFEKTVTTAADGAFSISDVPPGQYNVYVKGGKWLREPLVIGAAASPLIDLRTGNQSGAAVRNANIGLRGGDAIEDNIVDSSDFGVLNGCFGASLNTPGSGYDPTADFNNDGSDDSSDFGILIGNFGQAGQEYATNLRTGPAAGGVALTWKGSPTATKYYVYRSNDGGATFTALPSSLTPYAVDAAGTSSSLYRVTALNVNSEEGLPSNVAGNVSLPASLDSVDRAQPGWAEDILPTDSPATAGAGPSAATSIDVTSGILENHPGPDLDAHNPVGLSPSFGRLYRSAQAERNYRSPGLSRGWSHNLDLRITQSGSLLTLIYPNGAKETWTANAGAITPNTPGTPYVVTGTGTAGAYTSLTMQFKDRTAYVFSVPQNLNDGTLRLTKMVNAVGSAVTIFYNNDGSLNALVNDASPAQTLLTFGYNGGSGLLSSVTDNVGGRVVSYSYDTSSNLSAVSQVNAANTALWAYKYTSITNTSNGTNTWPLLTQVGVPDPTQPTQNQIAYYPASQSDGIGRVTGFTDANNNQRNYNYGNGATTVEAREPDGTLDTTWTQTFNSSGADTGTVDAYGYASHIVYGDANNPKQPTSIKNRNGQETTIVYDGFGNLVSIKTPFKHDNTTQYLMTKFAFTYTDPTFPFGRLDSVQEGNFSLNEFRAPTTYTYYNGAEIKNGVVQPKGLLHLVTGPIPGTSSNPGAALVQEYIYTALGNVSQLNYPAPNNNAPAAGQPYSFVSYTFSYTTPPYAGAPTPTERLGQPTLVTPPGILTRSGLLRQAYKNYDYDAYGNVIYEADRLGITTRREYNNYANQVTKITFPPDGTGAGNYLVLGYGFPGGGVTYAQLYSPSGALIQTSRSLAGKEGEFASLGGDAIASGHYYDALYRARAVQDGKAQQTGLQYDLAGNAKRLTFPGNTGGAADSHSATYDADGNPATQTNGDNLTTLIIRESEDSQVKAVQYTTRPSISLAYDDYGRVNDVSDATAEQQVDYDDLDNITEVRTIYKDIPNQPTRTVHYDYFPDGSRKDMVTPAGTYYYTYYDSGQIYKTDTPWLLITDYYQNNGRLLAETTTTHASTPALFSEADYTLSGRGLITSLINMGGPVTTGGPATALQSFNTITYDVQGNRRMEKVDLTRANNAPPIFGGTLGYGYDAFNRLTSETSNLDSGGSPGIITQTYTPGYDLTRAYDAAGNMTQVPGQGSILYNINNQILGAAKNGNGDATGYGTFNETSQLTKANTTPVGPGFTAGYLADGRRAWKQSNASGSTRFYYLYDGDKVVAELDANGNVSNAFGWGFTGLVTRQESAPAAYHVYLYDPNGNAAERLTATNSTNRYMVDYVSFYDAYGTQRSQVSAQSGKQYPTPDMVGFRGQFGVWTDNETSFVDSTTPGGVPLEIRSPGVWTGTDYYDPAYARALSRQTYLATQNLLEDAAQANLYAADPNPLGHSLGSVLSGVTGGYFGGPEGSAVAVGAWESIYSYGERRDAGRTNRNRLAAGRDFRFDRSGFR